MLILAIIRVDSVNLFSIVWFWILKTFRIEKDPFLGSNNFKIFHLLIMLIHFDCDYVQWIDVLRNNFTLNAGIRIFLQNLTIFTIAAFPFFYFLFWNRLYLKMILPLDPSLFEVTAKFIEDFCHIVQLFSTCLIYFGIISFD